MLKFTALSLLLVLTIYGHSSAGETQIELNMKAHKAFLKADAQLNGVYQQVRRSLDAEGKLKLRDAQRAWIKFRDADCEWAADEYRGGSIMPLIYSNRAEQMTKTRIATLKARLSANR